MKIYIMVMLIALCNAPAFAQTHVADSLKVLIGRSKPDTLRIRLLAELCDQYINIYSDSLNFYAQKGLALAKKLHYAKGELSFKRSYAHIFDRNGNYVQAVKACIEAIKLAESIHNDEEVAALVSAMSSIYDDMGDYNQALKYQLKAIQLSSHFHNDDNRMKYLVSLGDAYEKVDRLDSARKYTQEGYEEAIRLKDVELSGIALNNLGNIHSKMHQPLLALEYFRMSLKDFVGQHDEEGVCESSLGMASNYKASRQTDSAMQYAHQSLIASRRGRFPQRELNASVFILEYFKSTHRIDSAFAYEDHILTIKDSLFDQAKTKAIQNMLFNEQLRQQELVAFKEEAAEQRRQNIQMMAIGAFIPLFFSAVLIISRRKVKPRTIEFMSSIGLLLLFEFITLLIHPRIEEWTHHTPIFMLLILVLIASFLVPLHERLEHSVKHRLIQGLAQHPLDVSIEEVTPSVLDSDEPLISPS